MWKQTKFGIRILSLLIAGVLALPTSLVACSQLPADNRPHYSTLLGTATTDLENYTHQPFVHDFDSTVTPTSTGGMAARNIVTDWGAAGIDFNQSPGVLYGTSLTRLKYGTTLDVAGEYGGSGWYDGTLDAWYWNDSLATSSRVWSEDWNGNYLHCLVNDSYVGSWQISSETSFPYTGGTKELNLTLRFTIFKQEPFIKADWWIRIVNASSAIEKMIFTPLYESRPSYTDWTTGVESDYMMGYRVKNDGTMAVGRISHTPATNGGGATTSDKYLTNRSENMMAEQCYKGTVILVIGSNLADLRSKATRASGLLDDVGNASDFNFVYAKNLDTGHIDAARHFNADGFTIVPTGEDMQVYHSGSMHSESFSANPILNYAKTPVLVWMDDMTPYTNTDIQWLTSLLVSYQFPMSIAIPMGIASDADLIFWANYTDNYTHLCEMAGHNWDHNYYEGTDGFQWQYDNFTNEVNRWAEFSDRPLISWAAAGGAWNYATWDAYGAAGCKNIRLSLQHEEVWPMDYNLSLPAYATWVTGMNKIYPNGMSPSAEEAVEYQMKGHQIIDNFHPADISDAAEKAYLVSYIEWVQNQTGLIPLTITQWSDLWHHRILCYNEDGKYTVDLSDATTNHELAFGPMDGALPLLWDVTGDEEVTVKSMTSEEIVIIAEQGHVYRAVAGASFDEDAEGIVTLTEYDATAMDPLATISANLTDGDLTICLYGLDTSGSFQVSVDGITETQLLYADDLGTLEYTYTGIWSVHTFTFAPSYLTELTGVFTAVFAVAIVISIMAGLIGIVIGSRKK